MGLVLSRSKGAPLGQTKHNNPNFILFIGLEDYGERGITSAIIIGKEYLDGKDPRYERIEIKFDRDKK
jgi:hypothetical protein